MKSRLPAIFWIVLASFLIRLVFLVTVSPSTIDIGGDDAGYYHKTGIQLKGYFEKAVPLVREFLAGKLFQGKETLLQYGLEIPWGAFKRGPVYPFFLGCLFWILGPGPFPVFVMQALLMSLACGWVYGIGKELGEARAGFAAAILMGIYPPLIFIVGKLFQESLAIFLFTLFYFLAFRCRKKGSVWPFLATGAVLFLLSLSRTTLAFFPFFLFVLVALTIRLLDRKPALRHAWVSVLAFLIPYGIWSGIVSWQFGHPAVVVEPVGREILSALVPDYDGWTPDTFLGNKPDEKASQVLVREGIREPGVLEWPSQPKMVSAALRLLWEHPWISFRLAVDKFRRFWWQPFDWPWREFLYPPQPVRWLHRFVVIAGFIGGMLWFFERPLALAFLWIPLVYGSLFHSFFHIESRYAMIFLVFLMLFAGYLLQFLWQNRGILFAPPGKGMTGLIILLAGGGGFVGSQTPFLLSLFPSLSLNQAHYWEVGIQSFLVAGLWGVIGFWLGPILARRRFAARLLFWVSGLLILVSFVNQALSETDRGEWEAPIRNFEGGVRQEIFLPSRSLNDSVSLNLRLDLKIPRDAEEWGVWINDQWLGSLEMLKTQVPAFFLAPPYRIYLQDARKKPFEVRQWFTLPIRKDFLKENNWNTIEIRSKKTGVERQFFQGDEWKISGDYPFSPGTPSFRGPLFQRTPTETSVFSFWHVGDFRLKGRTPLHHQGVRAAFYDGKRWRADDLSVSPGIQKGEYRIRIEIEHPQHGFLVY